MPEKGIAAGNWRGPYGLPRTDLFSEFCQSVVEEFQLVHQVQAVSLEEIHLEDGRPGSLHLTLSDGSLIQAGRLVIATGAGEPVLPNWVRRISRPYPKEALQHSRTIDLAAYRELQGQHVLIVGVGLTRAHLALGAVKRGAQVSLLCRRKLRSKLFDTDTGWLGPKYLKAFQSESCWRLVTVVPSHPGSPLPCRGNGSRAVCRHTRTARSGRLCGAQDSGRSSATKAGACWRITSGSPPATTWA